MVEWAWDRFAGVVAAFPDRPAVKHGERAISFTALLQAAESLAGTLDLAKGDRAIICAPNSIDALAYIAAIWHRGAIPVLVNHEAPAWQITHAADTVTARAIYAASDVRTDHPSLIRIVGDYAALPPVSPLPSHGCTGADMASVVFTSGSTGRPKGVVQRAATLIDGAERIRRVMGYDVCDSILCPVPFTFDYGWGQALSMFFTGVTLVLPQTANGFGLCEALRMHRPSVLAGVPAVFADLAFGLAPLKDTPRDSIRLISSTGSRIPNPVFDALIEAFPAAALSLNYGLTETYRSATLPLDLARSHRQSVGRAMPGVELLVLREDGTIANPDEEGEICHFGAGLFEGYWGDPEATAATRISRAFASGITLTGIRTGDYGHYGEAGLLFIRGRRDRIVKCMGVRVSLAEIEDQIYETGTVREVAVTGQDHEMFGTFITAHIVPSSPASNEKAYSKQLRSALRAKLNAYMLPRRFVVHEALPQTTSRKVDYPALNQH
jgi:long-chain acyl-CoA synthetase